MNQSQKKNQRKDNMEDYTLEEPSKEESEALTKDLQEVLAKHNCEMGVSSSINLLKRVPKDILSPIQNNEGEDKETKA